MDGTQFDFQVPVWTFTYSQGPQSGTSLFHSPQQTFSKRQKSIILRRVGSEARHGAWANSDPSLVTQCNDSPSFINADGVIIINGWGDALCQKRQGALMPYSRGERIWIEESVNKEDEDGTIPVVSLDTFEVFRLPYRHVCFLPRWTRVDESGRRRFASMAVSGRRQVSSREEEAGEEVFFEWLAGEPQSLPWKQSQREDEYDWVHEEEEQDLDEPEEAYTTSSSATSFLQPRSSTPCTVPSSKRWQQSSSRRLASVSH